MRKLRSLVIHTTNRMFIVAERNLKTNCATSLPSIALMDKVSYLSLPESLHDCADHVQIRQTHHSFVYVRELHGDLRPEHICVSSEIEVIDCLEFDLDLRKLDCLEEVSFLGLECARLHVSSLERDIRGAVA